MEHLVLDWETAESFLVLTQEVDCHDDGGDPAAGVAGDQQGAVNRGPTLACRHFQQIEQLFES